MAFLGGCLCGEVRYSIERRHLNAIHCYCDMCRKAHGTAFSTHAVTRPDQFSWTAGQTLLESYRSSAKGTRAFCRKCGTHLLVHGQSGDGNLAVPAGTLDGDPEITIVGHMYVRELVSWQQIADDLPQYDEWPPGYG